MGTLTLFIAALILVYQSDRSEKSYESGPMVAWQSFFLLCVYWGVVYGAVRLVVWVADLLR